MNIETFDNLEGVKLINLPIYLDNRGSFSAIPNPASYLEGDIVQINNSVSHKGVLRGMHHQPNTQQGKLVTCIRGGVYDMVYDNRPDSPTYQQSQCFYLVNPNTYLYVPRGYLHGFISLLDNTQFQYYIDNHYDPTDEETVSWKIMEDKIDWESLGVRGITKSNLIISDKDNI
jgi:dTDP-4-dehydrorhamnose 3,5-epimerase|tara:strand:+ start:47258 stop:47776 length:519 start_codon:yes stop_codon:yes gene_type:complete